MLDVLERRVLLAVSVTIDGSVRHQTMDGFGHSLRVFDDPHVFENFNPATGRAATVLTQAQQGEVMDRLYRDLELTRVRPVNPDTAAGAGIEPVNDNNDPNVTDLSKVQLRLEEPGRAYRLSGPGPRAWGGHVLPLPAEPRGVDEDHDSHRRRGVRRMASGPGSAQRGAGRAASLPVGGERAVLRPQLDERRIHSRRDQERRGPPPGRGFDTMFVTTDDVRSSWEGPNSTLISLNHTGATYDGYTLNKSYYTTGQFSRFIEPGADRINAQSSDAAVQTTAFLNEDGGLVVVAENVEPVTAIGESVVQFSLVLVRTAST
jgi:hypothetical protein